MEEIKNYLPLTEVYERYKHLDHLLSDEEWLVSDIQGKILYDLWKAIRITLRSFIFGPSVEEE